MSYDEPIKIDRSIPLECIDATKTWTNIAPKLIDECLRAARIPYYWISGSAYILPLTYQVECNLREHACTSDLPPPVVIVAVFAVRADGIPFVFVMNNIAPEKVIADITRIMKLKVFL